MPSAFEHGPALTVPASNTTAKAAVIWSAASNLGESTIILDSGGNGRIGIAGDLDTITITSGTVTVAGTVAATTLTGAGSGITALAAGNIATGTVAAARLGSNHDNARFLRGDNTWQAVSGTTINSNADNRVITGSGTANTLNGETNLTFDGSLLSLNSNYTIGDTNGFRYPSQSGNGMRINSGNDISFAIDSGNTQTDRSFRFYVNGLNGAGTQVLQLNEAGRFTLGLAGSKIGIGTDNPENMLHIKASDSGVDLTEQGHSLLSLEANGDCSMTIASDEGDWAKLILADDSSSRACEIAHVDDLTYITMNGSAKMAIYDSGNIGAPTGSNIYNASDERFKRNITNLTNSLDKVTQLQGVSFNWIEGFASEEKDKTLYGLIAQDVNVIDSNLVEPFGDEPVLLDTGESIENPLRVNEKFIIPMLVEAIKELKAEVDALKS